VLDLAPPGMPRAFSLTGLSERTENAPSEALIKACITESHLHIGDVRAAADESRGIIEFFHSYELMAAVYDVKVEVYQLLLFVKASVCLGSTFDAELVGDIAGRLMESPSVSDNT